jgi:hypothetical protein
MPKGFSYQFIILLCSLYDKHLTRTNLHTLKFGKPLRRWAAALRVGYGVHAKLVNELLDQSDHPVIVRREPARFVLLAAVKPSENTREPCSTHPVQHPLDPAGHLMNLPQA